MKTYSGLLNMNGNLLTVLDFETTGLQAGFNEIVQIAAIPLDSNLEPSKEIKPFYTNVAPNYPERANVWAMKTNGLKLTDLAMHAPSQERAVDMFVEWFEKIDLPVGRKLVPLAHNWPFEASFAKAWLGWELFDEIFFGLYRDSMMLANAINDRALLKAEPAPFNKVRLSILCKILKIVNERPHDAFADCIAEARVYKKLLEYEK